MTAGSINLNGTLTVEVRRPGGETLMGDIIHLVEEAQSREAPVQRLADKVIVHFVFLFMETINEYLLSSMSNPVPVCDSWVLPK